MKVQKEASVRRRYLLFYAKSFESGERRDGCSGCCQPHPLGQEGMGDMGALVAKRVLQSSLLCPEPTMQLVPFKEKEQCLLLIPIHFWLLVDSI